ncbi:unnamed protein product [Cladocopium goreaui]|uniref:FAST kinase leucine-rich domain-containing protein n=1 Tax=Cladocopium goreaui TaxID=2562237 RepID=A0A9P1FZ46_9DINO|nr:unnamed protein product [Cladocopium goreaui]
MAGLWLMHGDGDDIRQLAHGDGHFFEALGDASVVKIHEFGAQSLGNTGWAFAKRQILLPTLMEAVSAATCVRVREMKPQQLSNLV